MTITTHCNDRKEMVRKLAEYLGQEARYQGVPSAAYVVGEFSIDRQATISCENAGDLEALIPWLVENCYIDAGEIQKQGDCGTELVLRFPCDDFTPEMLKNLVFMLYSKQTLICQMTRNGPLKITDAVIASLKEKTQETNADFEALMDRFIVSGDLIGIEIKEGYVTISYGMIPTPDGCYAYMYLTQQIMKAAKEATRVFPYHIKPENAKYYMRSWLIRLGMDGPDHKGTRKYLLQNLKGHSAFRNDAEAQKFRKKYAAIRKEQRKAAKEAQE